MTAEDKYAIALGAISVVLLVVGTIFARWLSAASPRVVRVFWPVVALATLMIYGGFVLIARISAHDAG